MSEKYPLYPKLTEEGHHEAQKLMDGFKMQFRKMLDDALGDLYCDVAMHIESDSWTNYRNNLMNGLQNYGNRHVQSTHDFKQIRQAIFREFKDEIIVDLNQDLVDENNNLKERIKYLNNHSSGRY